MMLNQARTEAFKKGRWGDFRFLLFGNTNLKKIWPPSGFFSKIGLKSTILKLQKWFLHKVGVELNFQSNALVKKGVASPPPSVRAWEWHK